MNAKQSILAKIKDGSFALCTDEQIAKKLRLGRRESLALRDILHALCREGELLCDSRYRFGTAEQFGAKTGKFTGNERGFGFVTPEDGADFFIPHRATGGALHGDTVLFIPVKGRSDDEGEILAVLARGYDEIVGTYFRSKRGGVVEADERKFNAEIFIPIGKSKNCANGSKVVVKLNPALGEPHGEVIEILGEDGDFFTEELALIRSHRLREKFSDEVEKEAKKQASRPHTQNDLKGRLDLRNELIITVDGEDTRDIDDAISVKKTENNGFELGVHIADVSHYVTRNGVIDKEAFLRGTSVYFPDRVLPMLPKALSNDICSLNEGVDRLTLSCLIKIDAKGKIVSRKIAPSIIHSKHRMTYTDVTKIYEGDKKTRGNYPDLIDFIQDAIELTRLLKSVREKRGNVTMDIKEAKILYLDGKISIPDYERSISHEMIEQFMVLANECVATMMTNKKMPFIYRIHESPSEEKAQEFRTFLNEAGIPTKFDPYNVTPKDYKNLLKSVENSPLYPLINRVMLRSMMKAKYSPENLGHFGLASTCYCHFTSPIRRYPDLCIHRIIHESFAHPEETREKYEDFVNVASEQSSSCEKNAAEAERDVDALYITAYMQDKIGQIFQATISGVTSFGLFAELDNTIEGFIPLETLPDDYYTFIEERFLLKGTKNSYRLGEKVKVRVVGVDWGARRTQFTLLER